jgi:hypothetical protein
MFFLDVKETRSEDISAEIHAAFARVNTDLKPRETLHRANPGKFLYPT